jgi:predicted MFS family arabinose efflux permease
MSGTGLQSDSGPQQLVSALPRVSARLPHVRKTFSRYRDAQRSLRVPASRRSRHGLDWLNFFVADMQTGYGSFVAFYLAGLGWSQEMIGLALTTDHLLAVVGQIPGGAVADSTTWKRGLAGGAILVIAAASVILALESSPALIYTAQALHGLTAGVTTAAIAGISLGLVGRSAMSYRVGRNYRFSATGNAITGVGMGIAGSYFGPPAIFLAAAALCIPALAALSAIRAEEIDYARARNAGAGDAATRFMRIWDLRKNRLLFIFAGALILFQLADAAMLPAISAHLGQDHAQTGIITGAMMIGILVIIPQIVVALLAPWVGYHSERFGRKPLLLIGLAAQVLRALVLAVFDNYPAFAVAQVLDGVSGAIIGVLTFLVIIDLTTGTGRFNLARGVVATLSSIAAALSTAGSGFLIDHLGRTAAFGAMVAAAAAAVLVVLVLLPETKPEKYTD